MSVRDSVCAAVLAAGLALASAGCFNFVQVPVMPAPLSDADSASLKEALAKTWFCHKLKSHEPDASWIDVHFTWMFHYRDGQLHELFGVGGDHMNQLEATLEGRNLCKRTNGEDLGCVRIDEWAPDHLVAFQYRTSRSYLFTLTAP